MFRPIVRIAVSAVLLCSAAATRADEIGTEIDLTSFGQLAAESAIARDDGLIEEVSSRVGTASRRVYISGMIGPSFANVTSPGNATLASSDTLFNAGGAVGMAFERHRGQLRLEVEGMGRSTYDAAFTNPSILGTTVLTNNWSVMQNVWRDVMLTDRFGVYGGGGIGAGGYILGDQLEGDIAYADPAANFAWQFGGGLLWEITNRLTFDVGYRYFHIDTIQQTDTEPNLFDASELMFTLRFYEPFRNWRR
jgi:opacity protein-like surface antigen